MFLQQRSYKDLTILLKKHKQVQEIGENNQLCKNSKILKNTNNLEEKRKDINQVRSRSLKRKFDGVEISFEANFLNQHEKSFKLKIQNYIEKSIKQSQNQSISSQYQDIFQNIHPNQLNTNYNQPQIFSNQLLKTQQKIQFSKDLQTQEKLHQFLNIISTFIPHQLSSQIVYICFVVWQKYIQIRNPFLKLKDLKLISQQFAQQNWKVLFKESKINYLNFRNIKPQLKIDEDNIQNGFKQFLNYITLTIFLVIQQYFQNPYYQQTTKRKRDQQLQNIFLDIDHHNDLFQCTSTQQLRIFPTKAKKLF